MAIRFGESGSGLVEHSPYRPARVSRFSIEHGLKSMLQRDSKAVSTSDQCPLFIGTASPGPLEAVLARSMMPAYEVTELGHLSPCPVDSMAGHIRMFKTHWPQVSFFKSRKETRFDSNYAPSVNAYPELTDLVRAHSVWLRSVATSKASTFRNHEGWGAISNRWLADHGYYFRWLYPRSKLLYVIGNPYVCWLQYRRTCESVKIDNDFIVNFARNWRTTAVDLKERHRAVDGTVILFEQLANAKACDDLQDLLRFHLQKDVIRKGLEEWSERTIDDDERFELSILRDHLSDIASNLGYDYPKIKEVTKLASQVENINPDEISTTSQMGTTIKGPAPTTKCVILVPYLQKIEPTCENALKELEKKGYVVRRVQGFSAIDVARNVLVTQALEDGFSEILWIDDDMAFHPDAIDTIRSHGAPLIGGIVAKRGPRAFASVFLNETKKLHLGRGGGVIEVMQMGTGFLLTHRSVYEEIRRLLKLPLCITTTGQKCVPFFKPELLSTDDGHWYMAEDYAFVNRAKQCGYRVLADTTLRLGHIGSYEYAWEDVGIEKKRFDQFSIDI